MTQPKQIRKKSGAKKAGAATSARGRKPKPQPVRVPVVRLLPVIIFTAVLMLTVRLGDVWFGLNDWLGFVSVQTSSALAQTAPPSDGTDTSGSMQVAQNTAPSAPASVAEGADEEEDYLDREYTRSELQLLERLRERRQQIDVRERELEKQESLIMAAEARLDRRITELKDLEATIEGLLTRLDEQEQAKINQLVKIYATMKPKDAARIFNDLDMPILLTVIENMKESKVAPIIAEMESIKATALTEELSNRRRLPGMPMDGSRTN